MVNILVVDNFPSVTMSIVVHMMMF
jgi:hypothetical protein